MTIAQPLPPHLIQRYHGWHATGYMPSRAWYRRLADDGQHPRALAIACCDSRVHVTSIFGADSGEFFIHRNIASLVPEFSPNGDHHGTSAAIEYAVVTAHVAHILVMGHTNCGGIEGCHAMCSGNAPELAEETSFVGRWLEILRPGYERISHLPEDQQLEALGREGVRQSLENLMEFPFVRDAVKAERLSLHGLIQDIGEGVLWQLDGKGNWAVV